MLYLYSEYYRGEAEPSVHADATKARGAIDPASRAVAPRSTARQLWQMYTDLGLGLDLPDNAVEAVSSLRSERVSNSRSTAERDEAALRTQ